MSVTIWTNEQFTDADLIASFNDSRIARFQYEVIFFERSRKDARFMSVWADNKQEAKKLAREYAVRILNRSDYSIFIGERNGL